VETHRTLEAAGNVVGGSEHLNVQRTLDAVEMRDGLPGPRGGAQRGREQGLGPQRARGGFLGPGEAKDTYFL
jgi:hypothetical protein